MKDLHFKNANPVLDRDAIVQINIEYMEWVATGIEECCGASIVASGGQSVADYVASTVDKVCSDQPPDGIFYLVHQNGLLAGMVGLRRLSQDVAEIKRLYVRQQFRGKNMGTQLLCKVLKDARDFGYAYVRLDSAPFMKNAQRLYHSLGFTDRLPYAGTEVPETLHAVWRFMELAIN